MDKETFKLKLGEVFAEVFERVVKKNIGYSGDDMLLNVYDNAAISGVKPEQTLTTRINEKMIRFRNILENDENEQVQETLRETITDVCGLAALLTLVIDETPSLTDKTTPEEPQEEKSNWFRKLFS